MAPKAQPRPPVMCCRKWMEVLPAERVMWEWQVMHQFGHSRTTFSAATVADAARVDQDRAATLISLAEERKWIWTPSEGVWVGRLTARR